MSKPKIKRIVLEEYALFLMNLRNRVPALFETPSSSSESFRDICEIELTDIPLMEAEELKELFTLYQQITSDAFNSTKQI